MNRALKELQATCLLSGVRMEQTETRKSMTVLMQNKGIYKVAPILMWTTDQVHRYIADPRAFAPQPGSPQVVTCCLLLFCRLPVQSRARAALDCGPTRIRAASPTRHVQMFSGR